MQGLDVKSTTPLFQCRTKDWELAWEMMQLCYKIALGGEEEQEPPLQGSHAKQQHCPARRTRFPTVPAQGHRTAG